MAESDLTAERLRQVLHYDPETGLFKSIGPNTHKRRVGVNECGYIRVWIDGKMRRAHRLAWLYMTGEWPLAIDHINGDGCDNRWANLRSVSVKVNNENVRDARRNNVSGMLGVSTTANGKFSASIKTRLGGQWMSIYLGTWDDAEVAHAVYLDAKRRLHDGCTI